MLEVLYTRTFVKKYLKLDKVFQDEIMEKIEEFKDLKNHKKLKVHKLKKPFVGKYTFSVNFKIRILFKYDKSKKRTTLLLTVGGHEMYRK